MIILSLKQKKACEWVQFNADRNKMDLGEGRISYE